MAEHFLDRTDIRAVFQQMRSKGMAQCVRRDVLLDVRLGLIGLDDLPEALPGHALAADIHKERGLILSRQHLRADELHILAQRPDRRRIERDKPFLVVTDAADRAGCQIHVRHIERNELAHTDAGGIQQFQHCLVAVALEVGTLRLLKQQLDLAAREDLRELLLAFIRNQLAGRVFAHDALENEEGIKAFQRRDGAGNGRYRFSHPAQPGNVSVQDFLVRLGVSDSFV